MTAAGDPEVAHGSIRRMRAPGWWLATTSARALEQAQRVVPRVLEHVPSSWTPAAGSWTRTGTAVVPLAGPEGRAVMRLRRIGAEALQRETSVLSALAEADLPDEVRRVLPHRLAHVEVDRWTAVVDAALPGAEPQVDRPGWPDVQQQALEVVDALHRATACFVVVDDAVLDRWVRHPLRVLARAGLPLVGTRRALAVVEAVLSDELVGRRVAATWVHGDHWAGNLLVSDGTLTGLVDWDLAADGESPVHDHLHLLLHRRQVTAGSQLGSVVAGLLDEPRWTAEEHAVLTRAAWAFEDVLPPARVLLLMYWLRYASAMSARPYTTYSPWAWKIYNVRPVLACAAGAGSAA